MMGRLGIIAGAAGFCLIAGSALAQFPPITDPGKDEVKCQRGTAKALQKQVKGGSKCAAKCFATQRKTGGPYTDCFPPYGGDMAVCINDPIKGPAAKAKVAIPKVCADIPGKDKCPECYGMATCTTGEPFVGTTTTLTQLQGPNIYCTENGGNTPPLAEGKCEDGLAKNLVKFVGSLSKCYDKCSQNMIKGKIANMSCSPPVPTDLATQECLVAARAKANAALDKVCFVAPAAAPACYDGSPTRPNSAAGWTGLVESVVNLQTPLIACGA